jgi:hypothetical protein
MSMGSVTPSGKLINTGAPIDICKALAPIILAFSNRVYFLEKMGEPPN